MSKEELMAEMRAAAGSLNMAAAAVDEGDFVAAEISLEDALFRTQSLMSRLQEAQQPSTSAGYHVGEPKPDPRDRG